MEPKLEVIARIDVETGKNVYVVYSEDKDGKKIEGIGDTLSEAIHAHDEKLKKIKLKSA